MKISKIDHWMVRAPFTIPIEWGSGTRGGTTRLICRIVTDKGLVGWGETQCLIDSTPAAFSKASELAIGWDIRNVEQYYRCVLGAGYYHHPRAAVYAIAAVEMAMWDALGKALEQPLWALWGGKWRNKVSATGYVFASNPTEARRQLRLHSDLGHKAFKIKIGMGEDSDIMLVDAARTEVGDADIRLDVNGAWTRPTAKRQLARLAQYSPNWVEQPLEFSDLQGLAELRRQKIPIILDESTYTLNEVSAALSAAAMDAALLDPHQAGGLWQCIKAAALCEAQGVPVGLHSGGELAISQSAYIQLAASIPNMTIPIDTERAWIKSDISEQPPELRNGYFDVNDRPGLGVDVNETLVHAIEVKKIDGAYLDPGRPGWFPTKPSY